MGRIAILADQVSDQIAAGEVVERPASVVKELVENALDAGATDVEVTITGGGRMLIRVTDDGTGMERDDAVLAIERHATSKLREARELVGIGSFGFRGEALPAIASVSKFTLETATTDREGTRVIVQGGRLETVAPAARARGTTVSVERLFYNTPARRKFLRSARAETRAIHEALQALALARLDVTFHLESEGRMLLEAARTTQLVERVAALFGREVADELVPVDHGGVRGMVQRPGDARPAGRRTFLFVNGRPFRDHFLVRAAETGYRGAVHPGSRPTLFLSLAIPGDAVDVNVHPAKLEVRFHDKYGVERLMEAAVRSAVAGVSAAVEIGEQGVGSGERERPWVDEVPADLFWSDEGALPAPRSPLPAPDILQLHHTYLLVEDTDGLLIIDQHSAHERVLYERAMAELTGGEVSAQRLLLPITLNLAPAELDAVEAHREVLSGIGYDVEPFGGSSIVVHAVPNPHRRFDAQRCLEELATDLARNRFGGVNNRMERFAATFACRAAVKAGDPLAPIERHALVQQLFACALPPHDVHGRPTIVRLPRAELERRFGRA
jgi:DNA mismatch repair protein MutL